MPNYQTLKKSDVFISYGRKESRFFAGRLAARLAQNGNEVWIDQRDIPLAIDFQEQINDGINRADNFIFIIAPHSIYSDYCRKEINLAIEQHKRIIPVVHIEPYNDALMNAMHPVIRKLNWLYFREKFEPSVPIEEWKPIDNFDKAYNQLQALINTHKDYVEQHTRLLIKAINWLDNKRSPFLLLKDSERANAEEWFNTTFKSSLPPCTPSLIHAHFICESRKEAYNMQTDVYLCNHDDKSEFSVKIRNELMLKNVTVWNPKTDIRSGMRQKVAQKQAIAKADNFIFCITEKSVTDYDKLAELDVAVKLKKRLIPLLIESCDKKLLPPKLRTTPFIDFSDQLMFTSAIDALLKKLNEDAAYHNQHKVYLTLALDWEKQNYNQSILLRGMALERAKTWLEIASKKTYRPTKHHRDFIQKSIEKSGNIDTDVFLAYSRVDIDTARKINYELQVSGKNTWFDMESISQSANIRAEMQKGIEEANNFVFLISPNAVSSDYCNEEVEYAVSLSKRIVPVLIKPTNIDDIHHELKKFNWVDFIDRDFEDAYSELIRTLDTDREYVQNHTKWLRKANEWEHQQKYHADEKSLLLRGTEYVIAREWLDNALDEKKQPAPLKLIVDYIEASGDEIRKQEKKEREQQNQLLKLQQEKTKEAEKRLATERKSVRRQNRLLAVLIVAFLFSVFASVLAVLQKIEAVELQKEAEKQRDIARQKTELAERNEQIAKERLIELEAEKEKVKTTRSEADRYKQSLERVENEKETALSIIEEYEAEKQKLMADENQSEQNKKRIEEYNEKIKEQRSKMLTAYARNEYKFNKKLSFKIAERAYHQDNTNLEAYRICLNSFYDLYEPLYIVVNHDAEICAANFSPDNRLLVTASWDNTARLSNNKGELITEFVGHKGLVNYADFSANGLYIITAGEDKTVRIWNQNGTQLKKLTPHNEAVATAVFSKNNKKILTAGKDGYVYLLSNNGDVLKDYKHPSKLTSAFFSPDEKYIITAAYDNNIRIWSIDGSQVRVFNRQKDVVSSACYAPEGEMILTAGWDTRLRIYDKNRKLRLSFAEHNKKISSATYSPDGKYIVSTAYDPNLVYLMPMTVDKLSQEFDIKSGGYDIPERKLKEMGVKP